MGPEYQDKCCAVRWSYKLYFVCGSILEQVAAIMDQTFNVLIFLGLVVLLHRINVGKLLYCYLGNLLCNISLGLILQIPVVIIEYHFMSKMSNYQIGYYYSNSDNFAAPTKFLFAKFNYIYIYFLICHFCPI